MVRTVGDLTGDVEFVKKLILLHGPRPSLHFLFGCEVDDFEAITNEDIKAEYVDGAIIVHSPASLKHEDLTGFVIRLVGEHVARNRLGRTFGSNALMLLGDQRFSPDCSVLLTASADRAKHDRVVGPLDLVVEITSPSTRKHDHDTKLPAYREGRVGEIWLIDAERRQFEVHALTPRGYESRVLPIGKWESVAIAGLVVDVEWFWRNTLPSLSECVP